MVRQGPQQNRVDNAEHGRARPDAERERQNGYNSEARTLAGAPKGVVKVSDNAHKTITTRSALSLMQN